eukprot:12626360-Prorocentrum_lima.AAC.1
MPIELGAAMAHSLDALWAQVEEMSNMVATNGLLLLPQRGVQLTTRDYQLAWDAVVRQTRSQSNFAKASRVGSHRAIVEMATDGE